MDSPLKQRLIGAAVLAALAIIFLPMLLKGPDVKEPDAAQVPLTMPAAPDQAFSTHELPLTVPDTHTPSGGVLGMDTKPMPRPEVNAVPAPAASSTVPAATNPDTYPAVTPIPAPTSATAAPTTPAAGSATPPAVPVPAGKPSSAVAAPTAATAAPAPAPVVPGSKPATAAVAPDAVPGAIKPSAVAAGNYVVNVGSFTNAGNANALVARLRAAGMPVTSERVKLNGADAVRIRVGPYVDRTAAEAARLRAEAMAGGTSKVIALDGSERAAIPAPAATAVKPPVTATKPPAPAATPTASSAVPAPAVKPATAVTSGFAVQLAAPAEEAAALSLRDRARAAGFAAFVQRVDTVDGARFRVRAGPVADHNAAEVMRDAISQKLGISGNIVAHP